MLESCLNLRPYSISYGDADGIKHSIDVTADALYEAAILGMMAMKVAGWRNAPNLEIEVPVRAAEIRSAIHDAKARQPQVSLYDLGTEDGPVHPICGIGGSNVTYGD